MCVNQAERGLSPYYDVIHLTGRFGAADADVSHVCCMTDFVAKLGRRSDDERVALSAIQQGFA